MYEHGGFYGNTYKMISGKIMNHYRVLDNRAGKKSLLIESQREVSNNIDVLLLQNRLSIFILKILNQKGSKSGTSEY